MEMNFIVYDTLGASWEFSSSPSASRTKLSTHGTLKPTTIAGMPMILKATSTVSLPTAREF
jgi:hypothetical protein